MEKIIVTYDYKGWKYSRDTSKSNPKDAILIVPPEVKPVPDSLYKYYSLTPYNLDALNNYYLYASHPFELNDKFDCFKGLIDYNTAPDELINFYLSIFHTEAEIKERFYELKQQFKDSFPVSLFSGIGVISLTTKILNPLMWAHYASANHGFAVKFNHKYFHEKVLGPFPINYQEEWEPISLNDLMIAFLYITNIKSKVWQYEDEWRFIGTGQKMSTPRYKEDQEYIDNRKFKYQKDAIEEIILGNMFLDRINKYGNDNGDLVLALTPDVKYGEEKLKLLNFIVDNKIKTTYILLKPRSSTFELDTQIVEIQRIDKYSFIMKI